MQKPKHREGGKEFSRAKFENITAVLNRCIQNDFCGRAQNLPDIWGETGKLIEASQSGDLRDPHFSVTFVGSMRISVVYCMIAGNWNLRGNYVLKDVLRIQFWGQTGNFVNISIVWILLNWEENSSQNGTSSDISKSGSIVIHGIQIEFEGKYWGYG